MKMREKVLLARLASAETIIEENGISTVDREVDEAVLGGHVT